MVNQVHLPSSSASNTALSTISSTSPTWLLDSTCCNHMTSSLALWHSRLGHASISRVKQLVSKGLLGSVSNKSFDCMPCQFDKQTDLPFNNSVSHALSSFDLIHYDVWGPSPISTPSGSRYFVIFLDDFSRYTWIYLFKNRSELYQIYRDFTKMIETRFSKPIKDFKSDNAQEYKAHEFTSILHQFGTVLHSSCADTSQQNGRAKRKLRHILDVVRATIIAASTSSQFLGEAALTAVYTINRCPFPIVQNQTPYDLLFGSSPSYDLLRVFGCVCFVLLHDHERNKLQSRSRLCCFLRYGIG